MKRFIIPMENGITVVAKQKVEDSSFKTKVHENFECIAEYLRSIDENINFGVGLNFDLSIDIFGNAIDMGEIENAINKLRDIMPQVLAFINDLPEEESQEPLGEKEEVPEQDEIRFVKQIKKDGPYLIRGLAISLTEHEAYPVDISSKCFTRMLDTYLEKYGENS